MKKLHEYVGDTLINEWGLSACETESQRAFWDKFLDAMAEDFSSFYMYHDDARNFNSIFSL